MNSQNQFGLFAKDAQGNPMEIGTAPGQANLFDRERFKTRAMPQNAAPVSDIPGQIKMFVPPLPEETERSPHKIQLDKFARMNRWEFDTKCVRFEDSKPGDVVACMDDILLIVARKMKRKGDAEVIAEECGPGASVAIDKRGWCVLVSHDAARDAMFRSDNSHDR